MRALQALGGILAVVASILLLRIVLHAYTDHGHMDVLHLLVAAGAAGVGLVFVRRAFSRGA